MADEIDRANEAAELFLSAALSKQQQQEVSTPKGVGMCLNCEDDLDDDRRWCDAACRDEYFEVQKQNQGQAHDED